MSGGASLVLVGLALALVLPPIAGLLACAASAVLLWSKGRPSGSALAAGACFVVGPAVLLLTLVLSPPGMPIYTAMAGFVSAGLLLAGNAVSSTAVPEGSLGRVSAPLVYLVGVTGGAIATSLALAAHWAVLSPATAAVGTAVALAWIAWSVAAGPLFLLVGAVRLPRGDGEEA